MRHRGHAFAPVLMAVAVALLSPPPAGAGSDLLEYLRSQPQEKPVPRRYTEEEVEAIEPSWANPYLAFLPPDADPDLAYWRARARFRGRDRKAAMEATAAAAQAAGPLAIEETEPNDSQATAQPIPGFGTGDGDARRATVQGQLAAGPTFVVGPFPEDDGSIPLASETGLAPNTTVTVSGTVGDGPFGSGGAGSGDFDFFRVGDALAGDRILVDVDTPIPFGALDSFVVLFDASGDVVAFNDDDGASFDSLLEVTVPGDGDYFVSVGGYGSFSLVDPFDSSSGPGVGSEGVYQVRIGLSSGDVDFLGLELEAGDIVGAAVTGAADRLALYAPDGELRVASSQDLTFIHPPASPLPGGGNAVLSYVVEQPGTWAIQVAGSPGAYTLELLAETAVLRAAEEGAVQKIFVDFDGASVDLSRFGGPSIQRQLSPLASFLPAWGLSGADEDAVIDAILAALDESLSSDMREKGRNGDFDRSGRAGEFDVEILNSRDHPEPVGDPRVSRVVVGGTIPELGLATIGIASSIDVGNFETADDAVVLLDLLSGPPSSPSSLNGIPLGGGATLIDLIGVAVGNIVAHEAGHYSGNWHTEQFFGVPNIMDQGGNLPGLIGLGPDGVFGTLDDADVDFGRDVYVPSEGFFGTEDTLNSVAFGYATPVVAIQVGLDVRPGIDPNTVNTRSNGQTRIAVLGSPVLDVSDIDGATVAFGPAGAAAATGPKRADVNKDGFGDLVFALDTQSLGVAPGLEELCADGLLLDGTEFLGCDSIATVPRACGFAAPGGGSGTFLPAGPPNGGFESGDFTAWLREDEGSGSFRIDDGSFDPPGPAGPAVPFAGAFFARSEQTGPGVHTLSTDVTLDRDLVEAKLAWADRIENAADRFRDPIQEWRVEVRDPRDDSFVAELFSTDPGDPSQQDWTEREADLTPWIGETIRIAFVEQDGLFFFNAGLDAVQVLVRRQREIAIDVRPGGQINLVNPVAQGSLPVAILGSPSLDVTDLDTLTLGFGPDDAAPGHDICNDETLDEHLEDVNGDGQIDLLVHFRNPDTGLWLGDTEACVRGATLDGVDVIGCDEVVVQVPACGQGPELLLLVPLLRRLARRRPRR